ncbi:glycosyltransferase [Bacteroides thetaiotaomicron]|uniref:Glycosyltransferase n=1 Tax=Bacteroides thetaiotaomicron TaxID=818 RepID=A0AA46UC31_BACT4|nr:glycosyltransferase [Bacteroides thetaiotaomicron]UYU72080.1 glycosyltransferase [Bacteroides thetaiotaomicron]
MTDALEAKYGKIYRVDTLAKNSRFLMPFQLVWAMMTCKDIIILPAHNGLVVLSKFLTLLNTIFDRRLHYSVIGGWLQDLLPEHPDVIKALHKFTSIYVETQTMMDALQKLGFTNVCVVPNCKPLSILKRGQMPKMYTEPYKLVTFSRVTEKKGIGTAADLVMKLNEKYDREVFTLDIYGPVDPGEDKGWFAEQQKHFTGAITYKGNVPFNKSVEILSGYFALLFPTQYYTEGIPGTIIDSYAAGVPVISARWKSYADVVIEGVTGLGYEFNTNVDFERILESIVADPSIVARLKDGCIKKAEDFLPENAIKPLFERIK